MADDGWQLSDEAKRDFDDMRKFWRNFRVTGDADFRKTRDTCTIHVRPARPARPATSTESLPEGQYVGMVLQMVAQHRAGYDWVPAVDAP